VVQVAAPTAARALLADLPKLHFWGGEEQVGGLNSVIGERMITELARYESPRVIETGAGATTLLFCCLDPGALVSIAPSAELRDRIFAEAAKRQIALTRLFFVCDRSELALPRIAADRNQFDVGLIDGSHNWPSVFVDFCYINVMMPAGGTLFVDDIHLYSVSQLFHLLRQQEQFEFIALDNKMATFRKLVHQQFLPEWNQEPYIAENSPAPAP
jgi:Methyltransferase domain